MSRIVTITGPSLSGKTTLMRRLQSQVGFREIVSHTTRPMRNGEKNHLDYHFVTEEEFSSIPMAEQVTFGSYRYGVAVGSVLEAMDSGNIPLVIVEPNGAKQIAQVAKWYGWSHIKVFVDINPQVQRTRFASRMFDDLDSNWETYRARFKMLAEERYWVGLMEWDYFVSNFDQNSEGWIVPAVANFLHSPDPQQSPFRYG